MGTVWRKALLTLLICVCTRTWTGMCAHWHVCACVHTYTPMLQKMLISVTFRQQNYDIYLLYSLLPSPSLSFLLLSSFCFCSPCLPGTQCATQPKLTAFLLPQPWRDYSVSHCAWLLHCSLFSRNKFTGKIWKQTANNQAVLKGRQHTQKFNSGDSFSLRALLGGAG